MLQPKRKATTNLTVKQIIKTLAKRKDFEALKPPIKEIKRELVMIRKIIDRTNKALAKSRERGFS